MRLNLLKARLRSLVYASGSVKRRLKWTSRYLIEADLFTVKRLEKLQLVCPGVYVKMSLLYGQALWDSHTLELVEFKATEIANQTHHSPVKALEEISELIGDQWRDTDVIDFINKIRSGGT